MEQTVPVSDREFVADLRQAVERYFRAVDEWEAAYRKYYRLPDPQRQDSQRSDRTAGHLRCRARQSRGHDPARPRPELSPRSARSVDGTDAFAAGPIDAAGSLLLGLSRAERTQAIECLLVLAEAYAELPPPAEAPPPARGFLRRLLDFFY
jgi:hypothetical protein